MIIGASARSFRKALTWVCRIQVRPLLARFIDFNAAAIGTSSGAITPVRGSVRSWSTTTASSHGQHRLPR